MKNLKRVCFELSLKPFKSIAPEYIEGVCRQVFTQWKELIGNSEQVAIMMWTSDGSELLDYKGNLEDVFEWDRFIGGANPRQTWNKNTDPERRGLHSRFYDYTENPPVMRYKNLKEIIATLKRIGKEMTGKDILVGETFDPGPEFALSDFKYNRHNEICEGVSMGVKSMVCCYYSLNGDDVSYAAYPNGIPDGTPFGEFLGKQSQIFLKDMGFDYIWLSNGFGFGTETWGVTGALYNGKEFFPEKIKNCEEKIAEFWKLFRTYCSFPIETRGTNLTVGVDYSSDAVNHKMIYEDVSNLLPPPNSPWAALDGNFGLELAGYMSRAAELPAEDYLFRFYIHDPWWLNSPWIDRYEGQPHDIYLPMSCARINKKGETVVANHLNILSIDNSFGDMPDRVPREVTPYLLGAYQNAPDEASPFVWVYPFREYSTMAGGRLEKSFFEDWYIIAAINRSLPLSTVISTDNFVALRKENSEFLKTRILVSPVPERGSVVTDALIDFAKAGGKVMLYGSLKDTDERLVEALGLKLENELTGLFTAEKSRYLDNLIHGNYADKLFYNGILTDGGLTAVAKGDIDVLVSAEQNGEKRVIAHTVNTENGGKLSWCRGSDCSRKATDADDSVKGDTTVNEELFPVEILLRAQAEDMGFTVKVQKLDKSVKEPVVLMHRNSHSVWFSGYCPDTTVKIGLKTPLGAPLLLANETYLEDGIASYHLPRAWRHECRIFVSQENQNSIHAIEAISTQMGVERRIQVNGLKNATVYVLPKNGNPDKTYAMLNSIYPHYVSQPYESSVEDTVFGKAIKYTNISGTLLVMDKTEDWNKYN
ncbi:MAG: hypothetical protein E7551_09685 [Ruminococcaceae bacterium]|nr:hypothetical protein [Oscillospiraceae bacterium]